LGKRLSSKLQSLGPGAVVHASNPSYLGSRDRRTGKISMRPYLRNQAKSKRIASVSQVVEHLLWVKFPDHKTYSLLEKSSYVHTHEILHIELPKAIDHIERPVLNQVFPEFWIHYRWSKPKIQNGKGVCYIGTTILTS
jgi:hypothetical protein